MKKIEIEYVHLIRRELKAGKLDTYTAQDATQHLLSLLPFASYEEMKEKITTFCAKYPALEGTMLVVLKEFEEQKTQEILLKLRTHMGKEQSKLVTMNQI